jgi:hypothetical protein
LGRAGAPAGARSTVPAYIGGWWLLLLLGGFFRILAVRVSSPRDMLAALQLSAQLELLGFGFAVAAAALAIAVVRRLTARQEAKASVTGGLAGGPRPPGWPYLVAGANLRGAHLEPPGGGPVTQSSGRGGIQ